MDIVKYKQKLIDWNSTPKYKKEIEFLYNLINPDHMDSVLDYGCGMGATMNYFRERNKYIGVYGYDVTPFDPFMKGFLHDINCVTYHHVYFNHSIAHIEDVRKALRRISHQVSKSLTIITPNREYLEANPIEGYVPDPTVIKHYTLPELIELVSSCGFIIKDVGHFGEYPKGMNERIFLTAKPNRS